MADPKGPKVPTPKAAMMKRLYNQRLAAGLVRIPPRWVRPENLPAILKMIEQINGGLKHDNDKPE